MANFDDLLFAPAFASVLTVPAIMNVGSGDVAITVFDNTRAKTQASSGVELHGVGPAADVRIPELTAKGITRDQYKDATLTFNGRTWTVRSYELQGSPNGEDLGLVRFLLMAMS